MRLASLATWLGAERVVRRELAERVRVLTETRRDAVDTSAAELRRIERDLHDGAQARLVAMGMDLSTIEMLLDKDPAKAKQLLAQTRQSSVDALGLRGTIRPRSAARQYGACRPEDGFTSPLRRFAFTS